MKITLLCLLPLLLSCIHQPKDIAGGSSEQGNAFVKGTLYTSTGLPAKHATVRVYTVRHNPQTGLNKTLAALDTAVTNDSGIFTFDTLPADTFNIFGDSGTSLSYEDSIPVGEDSVVIPPDTLQAPGSLVGTIQLRAGDDPRKVLALFFGSTAYTLPDSLGRFTLSNLAAGQYSVRFLPSGNLDYAVLDTSLTIQSGKTDTVVIKLKFTGIPTPTGLEIAYDTLKQIVTLTWDREDTALVKGYNVYRRNSGLNGNPVQLGGLVADTVYRDSTGVQDSMYEYQVTSVSKGSQEGAKSTTNAVIWTSSFFPIDTLLLLSEPAYSLDVFVGKIFVGFATGNSNFDSAKILKYDTQGVLLKSWPVLGGLYRGGEPFKSIKVLNENKIFVINKNHQVLQYDSNGVLIQSWSPSFNVKGFEVFDSSVFLGNVSAQLISKFTVTGDSILSFGQGIIQYLGGIVADNQGNVYVADNTPSDLVNNHLFKFQPDGSFLDTLFTSSIVWGLPSVSDSSIFLISRIGLDTKIVEYYLDGSLKSRWTGPKDFYCFSTLNGGHDIFAIVYNRLIIFRRK